MHITDDQLATYKKQGFLIIENFLSPAERQAALEGFFTFFAPPYKRYLANDRQNDTPRHARCSSPGTTPVSTVSPPIPTSSMPPNASWALARSASVRVTWE